MEGGIIFYTTEISGPVFILDDSHRESLETIYYRYIRKYDFMHLSRGFFYPVTDGGGGGGLQYFDVLQVYRI